MHEIRSTKALIDRLGEIEQLMNLENDKEKLIRYSREVQAIMSELYERSIGVDKCDTIKRSR